MIAMSIIPFISAVVVVVLVVVVVSVVIVLGYIVTVPLMGVGKTEKQRKSVCVCIFIA